MKRNSRAAADAVAIAVLIWLAGLLLASEVREKCRPTTCCGDRRPALTWTIFWFARHSPRIGLASLGTGGYSLFIHIPHRHQHHPGAPTPVPQAHDRAGLNFAQATLCRAADRHVDRLHHAPGAIVYPHCDLLLLATAGQ